MAFEKRIRAEVNLGQLAANYRAIAQKAPQVKTICVVKANAYGLGARAFVETLSAQGTSGFGVADLTEALQVKEILAAGPSPATPFSIQILSAILPDEIARAIQEGIILPIVDLESAKRIDAVAATLHTKAICHVKLDTGMGRLGIPIREAASVMRAIAALKNISCEGVFTHCPMASDPESPVTRAQIEAVKKFLVDVAAEGIHFAKIHMAASDCIRNFPEALKAPFTHMRVGLVMFEGILTLRARVAQVRTLPAGTTLGYCQTATLSHTSRIATLAAGYADGLPLSLSNRGSVLVKGVRCPILGRISMDYTTVDVSAVPTLEAGDWVTLLGQEGTEIITPQSWGVLKNTHMHDILVSLGPRVERTYIPCKE